MFNFLKSVKEKTNPNSYQSLDKLIEEMVAHIDIKEFEKAIEDGENRKAWETFARPLDDILKYQSSRASVIDGVMNFELKVRDYYEASVHNHIVNKLNVLVSSDKVKFIAGYPRVENPRISVEIENGKYLNYDDIYLEDVTIEGERKVIKIYADCTYDELIVNFFKNEIPAIVYGDVNRILHVSEVEIVNKKTAEMVNLEQYHQKAEAELVTIDKLLEVNKLVKFNKLENSIIPVDASFRFRSMKNMLCLLNDYDLRADFKGVNYVTLVVDTEDPDIEGGACDDVIQSNLEDIASLMTRAISDKFYYELEVYDLNKLLEITANLKGFKIKVYDNMEDRYIN